MAKFLNSLVILVGGWLLVSPFILGYSDVASMGVCIGVGLVVIALAFISIQRKADQWPSWGNFVLGVFLILWGAFIARLFGATAGVNEILVGILLVILDMVVLPFQIVVPKSVFFNRSGGELATVTQIRIKNDNILAKSILLGSMPETIYVRPEELCKMMSLMDIKVILSLPGILYKGWRGNRSQSRIKPKVEV